MSSILYLKNIPDDVPVWVVEKVAAMNRVPVQQAFETNEDGRRVFLQLKSNGNLGRAIRTLQSCEVNGEPLEAESSDQPVPEPPPRPERKPRKTAPRTNPFADIGEIITVGEDEGKRPFAELDLHPHLLANLAEMGFEVCTPIQGLAIPPAIQGRDVVGRAETGSGKTFAFALPIVNKLLHHPAPGVRALVLAPTRELAIQINEVFETLVRNTETESIVLYGGENILDQMIALRNNIGIVIATPGRLLDIQSRGRLRFDASEFLVLDEADRMLDMGFWPQIRDILNCFYAHPQTLFFSATIPDEVKKFMKSWLENPAIVDLGGPDLSPLDAVTQEIIYTDERKKDEQLYQLLDKEEGSLIVFVKRKRSAEQVVSRLKSKGYSATRIHGDIEQSDRLKAVEAFREGRFRILVATDVAARGLHVDNIAHVINYDLAHQPEDHVHRIGRTARAGASGRATTFITPEEQKVLRKYRVVLGLDSPTSPPD